MTSTESARYVMTLGDVERTHIAIVGGKGANLGELSRIEGVGVPAGFCVTTFVFARTMATEPSINELLEALSLISVEDRETICTLSAKLRQITQRSRCPTTWHRRSPAH